MKTKSQYNLRCIKSSKRTKSTELTILPEITYLHDINKTDEKQT